MRKPVSFSLLFLLLAPLLFAQQPPKHVDFLRLLLRPPASRFSLRVEKTLETETKTDEPDKAQRQWAMALRDENGHIDPTALYRANLLRRAFLQANSGATSTGGAGGATVHSITNPSAWATRGPRNVGGRTRVVVAHPSNSAVLFAGAVAGGLWKSTDGGTTWVKWGNHMSNIAVSCIVFDPADPNTVYMGTGERAYGDGIQGAGVFKSTNGGVDWQQLAQTASWTYVSRLAIASGVILAAADHGIWRSTNGGASWGAGPVYPSFFGYVVAFDPNNSTHVVGSVLDFDVSLQDFTVRAVYSNDSGASFMQVSSQPATLASLYLAFIEVAWAKSVPHMVYASAGVYGGNPDIEYGDLWMSNDDGHSYVKVNTSGHTGCRGYQCGLWVDPTNASLVVTSGMNLHRSGNGGVTLEDAGSGYILSHDAHTDIHTIYSPPAYNGSTNKTVYVGTDGGVFRTMDISTVSVGNGSWIDLNTGYQTSQYYQAAGDNGGIGLFVGGTQDNGTLVTTQYDEWNRLATDARMLYGGDGAAVAIDPVDKTYVYAEYQNLHLVRSTDGGQTAFDITNPIDPGASNFLPPFVIDPNLSTRMLVGAARLWRSNSIRTTPNWTSIRTQGSALISAVAVARWNSDVIWIGQDDSGIYKTIDGTQALPSWTAIHTQGQANLPDRLPTSILIDPDDSDIVYIAYGGYNSTNLWYTTNAGSTWNSLVGSGSNALPAAPLRTIARHPRSSKALYVGSDLGVYQSLDGGLTWATSQSGPDDAPVNNLTFVNGADLLLVATHGRGLWTVDTSDVATYAPMNLIANATSTTAISVSWTVYSGATSYELQKKAGTGSWSTITVGGANYTDSGLSANTTYLYRVRANLSGGVKTGFSNTDLTTTVTFDLDGQLAGTVVKASHLTEIRNATNYVLAAVGLPMSSFTAPTPGVTLINKSDIIDLRIALTQAYRAISKTDPGFTDDITSGTTPIKAVHLQELRNLVK